jgi:ATP-dependent DNA ligase
MSEPLTEEQKATLKATDVVFDGEAEAIAAALRRLDFLERKVQAADRLADAVRFIAPVVTVDYDEVTE